MTETETGARRSHRSVMAVLASILLGVIAVVLSVASADHQRHDLTLNVLDEQAHYDYVLDLRHGSVPRWGDRYAQETLRVLGCVGVMGHGSGDCDPHHRDPLSFAPRGYSYEAQQPPLGYVPFALTASPGADPRTALASARRGGVVWTAVTAALVVLAGRVLGLDLIELGAVLLLCLLDPFAVHSFATVNNDAGTEAAGAAALILSRVARPGGRLRMGAAGAAVSGLATGVGIGLVKGTCFVVPLALMLGDLIPDAPTLRKRLSTPAGRAALWRRHACNVSMLAGSLGALGGWQVIQGQRGLIPASVVLRALLGGYVTARIRWSTIWDSLQQQFYLFVAYNGAALYFVWDVCIMGSVVAFAFRAGDRRRDPFRSIALGLLVGLVALALFAPLLDYSEGHFDFYTPGRYALPLVPVIAVLLVRALRRSGTVLVGLALPLAALTTQLVGRQY